MDNKGNSSTQMDEELKEYVMGQFKRGKNRRDIAQALEEQGMTEAEAQKAVAQIFYDMQKSAQKNNSSGGGLLLGLLGGLLAAVVGGAVWAGIAIWTEREIGYIALGVGVLCGGGVALLARGSKGLPLQIVAALTSVLGIVIGKYGTFHHFFQKSLLEGENGAAAAAEYGLFSGNLMQTFAENLPEMMGGYDLLWVALAVAAAWSIPKPSGHKS